MRTFLLSLFIVVTLLFTTNNISKASCPPGYTQYSSVIFYPKPGGGLCTITVFYCLNNSPMGMNDVIITSFNYDFNCLGIVDFTDQNFWEDVRVTIITDLFLQLNIPLCNEGYFTLVTIEASKCWKLSVGYENNVLLSRILPCDGELGFCSSVYQLCYDYSQTPPNRITKVSSSSSGGGTCLNGPIPNVFPPFFPYESDCYYTCE